MTLTVLDGVDIFVCLTIVLYLWTLESCTNGGILQLEKTASREADICTWRRAVIQDMPLKSKYLECLSDSKYAEFNPSWMEPDYLLKGDSQQAAYVLVNGHTDLLHDIIRTGSSPTACPHR